MARQLSIIDVMTDPNLLGAVFAGPTWASWRAVLKAAFGLPLAVDELPVFRAVTGRTAPSDAVAAELWFVIARRGGKSMIAALVAVYCTCFHQYRLAPGERGVFMILAPDRRQCRVIKGYISGLLKASPLLVTRIARETKDAIELANGLRIEVHTASFRTTRGYTVVGCIVDEGAFLPVDDAAEPDKAIIGAIRPAMATVPGALLMFISSPYARRGELWRVYQGHWGKDDDPIFVVQADTRRMNPTVSDRVITAAYEQDEASARAEYGAEFRSDLEGLFQREALAECVVAGRRELPFRSYVKVPFSTGPSYCAFTDAASGSGSDSFTLAIAHLEGERVVLDAVRERKPPFSPEAVVSEFADLLKTYGLSSVTGDRWAGEWPRERFRVHGIQYEPATNTRSDLYLALLPIVNSGRIALLDHERLISQLSGLERRTARGGRDSVDHAPGAHDDVANVVAGVAVLAQGERAREPSIREVFTDEDWREIESAQLARMADGLGDW